MQNLVCNPITRSCGARGGMCYFPRSYVIPVGTNDPSCFPEFAIASVLQYRVHAKATFVGARLPVDLSAEYEILLVVDTDHLDSAHENAACF